MSFDDALSSTASATNNTYHSLLPIFPSSATNTSEPALLLTNIPSNEVFVLFDCLIT